MKLSTSSFSVDDTLSVDEKIKYYKKEWLGVHRVPLILLGVGLLCWFVIGLLLKNNIMVAVTPFLVFLSHGWRNNTMMTYVEYRVFEKEKKNDNQEDND